MGGGCWSTDVNSSKDRHFGNESQGLELAKEQKSRLRRSKWSNYMGSDGRKSCSLGSRKDGSFGSEDED